MEMKDAIRALTALGNNTRLSVFRLLVEAGPAGRMAGDIAAALAVPAATLSFHLKGLAAAGLVHGEPQGRYVCYRADFEVMNALLGFLTHNCCAGSPSADCAPSAMPSKGKTP